MAESRFDRLKGRVKREYLEKGYSEEDAERIAEETAAKVGREKYGEKKFHEMAEAGREHAS